MRLHDLVFFLSGAAALAYQVVWLRLAGRLIGSDALGAAVVLAAFMGGMALGARWLGPPLAHARDARRMYLGVAVCIGVFALLSSAAFAAAEAFDSVALRAFCVVLILGPATAAMGATFPLMGRLVLGSGDDLGRRTAEFYASNTLGAACGALLCPFLALPALGFSNTLVAAAALDLVAGLLALRLAPTAALPAADAGHGEHASRAPRRVLLATALIGASALAAEVVLTRIVSSVTGASIYAYGILLATFLAGLALGSRQGRAWLAGGIAAETLLARLALLAAPLTFAGALLLDLKLGAASPFAGLRNVAPTDADPLRLWIGNAVLAGLAFLPPTIAFGAALPAAVAAAAQATRTTTGANDLGQAPAILARVYAWNTFGATIGALAGGGLLMLAGVRGGLALALVPTLLAGWITSGIAARARLVAGIATVFLGLIVLRPREQALTTLAVAHGWVSTAAVDVAPAAAVEPATDSDDVLALRINGKVVASTAPIDLRLQVLLGTLPVLLHAAGDEPLESALVIGFGTGMTAAAVASAPTLERLDVVEISSAVIAVAPAFDDYTDSLLDDPRLNITFADGRPYLSRSNARYDLITADPIHPWTRGSSDLYSLEHFRAIEAHLASGGIASQWLPLYQLGLDDVRTIVATWTTAFAHCSAYLTAYDLVLIGRREGAVDAAALLAGGPLTAALVRDLNRSGIGSPVDLAALAVADDGDLRAFCAGAEPMRLDRPELEFNAPKNFLGGYSTEALRWAGRPGFVTKLPPEVRSSAESIRELLARFLESAPSDWQRAARDYGRSLLDLQSATGAFESSD